jgi:hypothetical protein
VTIFYSKFTGKNTGYVLGSASFEECLINFPFQVLVLLLERDMV